MARQGRTYKPTDADRLFVERAVKAGSRINDIADCLNITDDTLRKHFRYEIMTARERLKAAAVGVLDDSLEDGSLDAAKYVLSRVAGWVERAVTEIQGKDGGPIQTQDVTEAALIEQATRLGLDPSILGLTGNPQKSD